MTKNLVNNTLTLLQEGRTFLSFFHLQEYINRGFDAFILATHLAVSRMNNMKITEEEDIHAINLQLILAYVTQHWSFAKAIYKFSPAFLSTLMQTEDAPIYADVLKRLPYRDFLIELPNEYEYDGLLVHVEFDEKYGKDDIDTLFLISMIKSNHDKNATKLNAYMQWCRNGKRFLETAQKHTEAFIASHKNENGQGHVGNVTITNFGKRLSDEKLEKTLQNDTEAEKYLKVAVLASYYLASKNAEIKEIKVPKDKRPSIVPRPGAKAQRVSIKKFEVGFITGNSFEQQVTGQNPTAKETGTGRTIRPHVRRAHWHHYWTGKGRNVLEVRWIKPTLVLPGEKKEVPLATVRKVQGNI